MQTNLAENVYNGIDVLTVDFGFRYTPQIPPCADNDELAKNGRVVLYYRNNCDELEIKVIPPGDIYAGWVIGTFNA